MRKRSLQILFLLALIGALSSGVWAGVTEGPAPQVQSASPLVAAPVQPPTAAWLTPEKEAALVEVRKILKEARQVAEGIELPNRLTTRGMAIKDLQNNKENLINEIERAQFRIGDLSAAVTTKQPWYLAFAQVMYGQVNEAVATAAQSKLVTGTLLALIKMLADTGHLDAAQKVAEANLAKEQIPDWRYRDEAVVLSLLARDLANAGDARANETMQRALQAAQRVKSADDRALAFTHVSVAQAVLGDSPGSAESVRLTQREIPPRSELPLIVGRLQYIGKAQLEGGQRAEGEETLRRAIQLTDGLEPLSRAGLLGCIAWTRSVIRDAKGGAELLAQAISGMSNLPPNQRVRVLHDIGQWQLGLHQQEAAIRTARLLKEAMDAIEGEKEKAEALRVARHFATRTGDIRTALALLESTQDGYDKLEAMRHLVTVLVETEERDGIHPLSVIKRFAQEAPVLAKQMTFKDEVKARFSQKAVAVIKAAAGDTTGVLEVIEKISDDDFNRGYVYPEIIKLLVRQGNLVGARQVAHAYRGKWIYARNLVREIRELAKTQVKATGVQESLVWMRQWSSEYVRAYAMLGIAEALLEQNQIEDSNALLPRMPWQRGCPVVSELFN